MGKYLKAAFSNRWNLVALFAGLGASIFVPHPEIVLPTVLGLEAAYLAIVSTNPHFRNYVNVHEAHARRRKQSGANWKVVRRILRELPEESRERYEQLRARCRELRDIAGDLRDPGGADSSPLDSLHVESLDRLLWIFLRLLYTHQALMRFLDETKVDLIHNDIERLENRLRDLDTQDARPQSQKIRRTLEDNLATSQARLANYQKARENFEFVELEIDRLANKIKSLAEAAVRPQAQSFMAADVDEMTTSFLETERTMSELDFATGLGVIAAEPPELLEPTRAVQENRFG